MASGPSGAITNQGSRPEMPEKKAYGSDHSCKAALIALGIICMIGGAVAAGVLYSHLGYISLSCLGADLVGIILIALSSRCKPAHQSTTTPNPQQDRAESSHKETLGASTNGATKPQSPSADILTTLTQQATKDGQAFLIDFSQVNPSNMFQIFLKDNRSNHLGATSITDQIDIWFGQKPSPEFSFKYEITIVTSSSLNRMQTNTFAMDDKGRVEFLNQIFPDFNLFLEYFIPKQLRYEEQILRLDFTSVKKQTLRKAKQIW